MHGDMANFLRSRGRAKREIDPTFSALLCTGTGRKVDRRTVRFWARHQILENSELRSVLLPWDQKYETTAFYLRRHTGFHEGTNSVGAMLGTGQNGL
jgi:hypothetical protein